jgi:hypothetical protein
MTPQGWKVVEHYLDKLGGWFEHEVNGVTLRADHHYSSRYMVTSPGEMWSHLIEAMPAPDGNGVVWRVPDLAENSATFPRSSEEALALVAKLHAPSPLAVDLAALAARADELAAAVRAARDGAAEAERRFLWPLDEVAARAAEAGYELGKVAGDLNRYATRPAGGCPVEWGVCPEHGPTIEMDPTSTYPDRRWRCWKPDCERVWDYDRAAQPCTEPAAYSVRDPAGKVVEMCAGHVAGIRKLDNAHEWYCEPLSRQS